MAMEAAFAKPMAEMEKRVMRVFFMRFLLYPEEFLTPV
jgi:hypothetical protein